MPKISHSLLLAGVWAVSTVSAATLQKWDSFLSSATPPILSYSVFPSENPTPVIHPASAYFAQPLPAVELPTYTSGFIWGSLPFFASGQPLGAPAFDLYCDDFFLAALPNGADFVLYDSVSIYKSGPVWHFSEGVNPAQREFLVKALDSQPIEDSSHTLHIKPRPTTSAQ